MRQPDNPETTTETFTDILCDMLSKAPILLINLEYHNYLGKI